MQDFVQSKFQIAKLLSTKSQKHFFLSRVSVCTIVNCYLKKKTCCDATLKNPKTSKVYGKLFQSSWPIKPHFFFTNKDKDNNVLHVLLCTYYKADLAASATRNLANITFKDEQMIIKTWHNLLIYTRALFDVQ